MKIAVIIVSLLLAAAVIMLAWSRSKQPDINSFWDVVRNPDAVPDLAHCCVFNKSEQASGRATQVQVPLDRGSA